MKRILAWILIIVMLTLTGCEGSKLDWQEQLDLGIRNLSEGKYEEAIQFFNTVVETVPSSSVAYFYRADAYLMAAKDSNDLGKASAFLRQAEGDYKKVRELGGKNTEELSNRLEELENMRENLGTGSSLAEQKMADMSGVGSTLTEIVPSADEQYQINSFLSTFSEQSFNEWDPITYEEILEPFDVSRPNSAQLVWFSFLYNLINNSDILYDTLDLYDQTYAMYLTLGQVNRDLQRFFGITISQREFQNSGFWTNADKVYFELAMGETYGNTA